MHNSPVVRFGLCPRANVKSVGLTAFLLCLTGPLAAQDENGVTSGNGQIAETEAAPPETAPDRAPAPAAPPRPERRALDLMITVPKNDSDLLLEEDCAEESEAGVISNTIVVCRKIGEASDGVWNKEEFERSYAQRTQGEQPVDVAGGGIFRGPATVSGLCLIPPCPAEAALIIDIEALPEAPAGSDADRIARGLPPLGQDEDLSPEEIQRRRREAGLETPDLPGQ